MSKWKTGWGSGLTGPTCPWPENAFAGGKDWPHTIIHEGQECIAIIPAPETAETRHVIGKCGGADMKALEEITALILDAPKLAEQNAKMLKFIRYVANDTQQPIPLHTHEFYVMEATNLIAEIER